MKSRLGAFVALALLSGLMVAVASTPAEAAAFAARLSRSTPIVGELVKIQGAVPPAKRPVRLQKVIGGRWVGAASTRTGAGGAYAFTVRATASVVHYRVVAPKAKIKRKKAPARTSNLVRVRGVRPSMSLSILAAPIGRSASMNSAATGLATPATAYFKPPRPGASVYIQRYANGGWSTVSIPRQDSTGTARANIAAGSASDPRVFRAVSNPGAGAPTTYSSNIFATYFTNNFDDNFTDSAASAQKWVTRSEGPNGNRKCAVPKADNFQVNSATGIATLIASRQSTNEGPYDCSKHGFWHSAVVGTGAATTPFTATSGIYAAKVKFQNANFAHGAFWMQKVTTNGTEIDIVEYFGDQRTDGGIGNGIYLENAAGALLDHDGGIHPSSRSILGKGNTPSNGWHVYSVQWDSTQYIFRLDGVPIFVSRKPHLQHSSPEELVLSLATSDWELPKNTKNATSASMQVDWVRGWASSQ